MPPFAEAVILSVLPLEMLVAEMMEVFVRGVRTLTVRVFFLTVPELSLALTLMVYFPVFFGVIFILLLSEYFWAVVHEEAVLFLYHTAY